MDKEKILAELNKHATDMGYWYGIPETDFGVVADEILNVLSESACPKCGQVNCPQHGYHYIEEQE